MIYESILDTIGNTPVVKLHRIPPKNVTIYVKVEAFNPLGSVKDRLALAIIDDAERRGKLGHGHARIEWLATQEVDPQARPARVETRPGRGNGEKKAKKQKPEKQPKSEKQPKVEKQKNEKGDKEQRKGKEKK